MAVAARTQAIAQREDKLAILRRHSLFGQLSPALAEHLGSYMRRRSLRRGAVIFAMGEPGTGLIGVIAGAVKISVVSADGRETVLSIMRAGDVFGEISLLVGRRRCRRGDGLRADDDRAPGLHSVPAQPS